MLFYVALQDKLYSLFSESKLTVTSLIPVELRSHESITEITEGKVNVSCSLRPSIGGVSVLQYSCFPSNTSHARGNPQEPNVPHLTVIWL